MTLTRLSRIFWIGAAAILLVVALIVARARLVAMITLVVACVLQLARRGEASPPAELPT